jgi:arylsulfatase A-like enzyme
MKQLLSAFRQEYDEDVVVLDRQLHRLLSVLDVGAAEFKTHVLITSDHGESFGEDGSITHGRRLTPSQIHIPFVLVSPDVAPALRDDVVGSIDLMPTLLSLAALPPNSPGGRDLLAAVEAPPSAVGMRQTFREPFEELRVDGRLYVHDDNLFYAAQSDGALIRGNRERIVDEQHEDLAVRVREAFGRFEDQLSSAESRSVDNRETLEALRSLGYVQ